MENLFSKLKNLNQAWVIVSRHNGNVFFKRKQYVTKVKNYPDVECLWYNEIEARNELAQLNFKRKKCKYTIENASKYFVNSFEYSRWSGKHIINKAISIKSIQTDKSKVLNGGQLKNQFVEEYTRDINDNYKRINDYQADIKRLEFELTQIQTVNFEEMLKPYETQGDRMVKVLFSTKDKTNEST